MKALRLKQNGTLRLEKAAGIVVEVTSGQVWLTQERDPRDYFLRAGDWLRIDRADTVVISALDKDASISFTPFTNSPRGIRSLLLLAPGSSLA
jgi:hypothetical protein